MKLDEEEMTWLRGGYENAVGIVESLKEQLQHLQENLTGLEKQKSDLKESYDLAMEQVKIKIVSYIVAPFTRVWGCAVFILIEKSGKFHRVQ